jgi:asparagine synthase (glutamine-hydrolysing)
LLEFLLAIPIDQVLRPGQRRSLMKRSLRDLLPSEIQDRRTKAGTGRCVSLTVEKNWRSFQENLASGLSCRFGFIDPKGLETTLREIKAGRIPVYLISFLKALSLELWMNDVVKRGVISISDSIQSYAEAA